MKRNLRISGRQLMTMFLITIFALRADLTFAQDASAQTDQINALVEELSTQNGSWRTGFSPAIDLPGDALAEEILAQLFEVPLGSGRVSQFDVLETRDVQLLVHGESSPGSDVMAVLVKTNLGVKIALLRFNESSDNWWTRVYDASNLSRDVPGFNRN